MSDRISPKAFLNSGISVVLTLVASAAVEGRVVVGLAPSAAGALQVVPSEGRVGRSGYVLAGIGVVLGEEGGVGPQLVSLEGEERLARLLRHG